MSVIVSVVAENTCRVLGWDAVRPPLIRAQIDAIYEDIGTDAVKIGMLPDTVTMETVAEKLAEYTPRCIVLDPVMYAKNGAALMERDAIDALKRTVIPRADLVTPNIPEAEELAGFAIGGPADARRAAEKILALGCGAVLVKGGHGGTEAAEDLLFDGSNFRAFSAPRIHTRNTHGTGCTLSSAIAANLALALPLEEAVEKAKAYVTAAIAHALDIGKGHGPTNHFYALYEAAEKAG